MADESRVKPQPLQPEELKAIEARCEAATPGPWRVKSWGGTNQESPEPSEWTIDGPDGYRITAEDVYPGHGEDVYFIAHARTDIPRLLATIEEARREQPVRVTDEQLLTEFREWLAAVQRADRAGIITIGFGVPQRVCAALAAAPKEGGGING